AKRNVLLANFFKSPAGIRIYWTNPPQLPLRAFRLLWGYAPNSRLGPTRRTISAASVDPQDQQTDIPRSQTTGDQNLYKQAGRLETGALSETYRAWGQIPKD